MNYARHREWELGLERKAAHEATLEAARVRVFELAKDLLDLLNMAESTLEREQALGVAIAEYEALAKEKP
jgi:hypothetical protein